MSRVSIIIPSRNERFLIATVESLFLSATGDIEVIVIVDGPAQRPMPKERDNLHFIYKDKPEGIRAAINDGAQLATGEYIMKLDAHCIMAEGFDEELQSVCEDNWIVVPRRYNLDYHLWKPVIERAIDYHYPTCPWTSHDTFRWQIVGSEKKSREKDNVSFDEILIFQGSLIFLPRKHFFDRIGGLEKEDKDLFAGVEFEMAFKTWLGGGKVIVNKNTWYSHYHRADNRRDWKLNISNMIKGQEKSAEYWTKNKWEGRIHDFDWLVDKFWPFPLHGKYMWPENWRKYYEQGINSNTI